MAADIKVGVVIPVGPGRLENVTAVMGCLAEQKVKPAACVLVYDGPQQRGLFGGPMPTVHLETPKHEPGMEQPRNIGVRRLRRAFPEITHAWFLDSDVIVEPDCLKQIIAANNAITDDTCNGLGAEVKDRILVAPYDWLPDGVRHPAHELRNDPRWPSFDRYGPDDVLRGDLAAGLACFSGNLVWPIDEFERVGGFWPQIHHGRCEDGELGLRAVAMDVPISFVPEARGWHLCHPVNHDLALARNSRDVPMLNARHPWVEGSGVFMVDRDGKAFDVMCPCGAQVPTIGWWAHAERCGVPMSIPADRDGNCKEAA